MDANQNNDCNQKKDNSSERKTNMDLDKTPGRVEDPTDKNSESENDRISKVKTNEDFNKQKPNPNYTAKLKIIR